LARYIAFLRGITPVNATMPDLKRSFESAGFTNVRTILATGNVAFDARAASEPGLERKAEAAMLHTLGHCFYTIVRPVAALEALLTRDPYTAFPTAATGKRVVSFLRDPVSPKVALPLAADGAQVLAQIGREVFTVYVPSPKGPVFMKLIEQAYGKDITTRTWDTVRKCAMA
jgi:uncharacterized protein (DUF1697 family)